MRAMRAVIDVISQAGMIRNQRPKEHEENIVYKALCDVHKPKFTKEDMVLFDNIIKDVFPDKAELAQKWFLDDFLQHDQLEKYKAVCRQQLLQPETYFLEKVK